MECPVCSKSASFFTNSRYLFEGNHEIIPIYYCKKCNTYIKKISDELLSSYFKISVYTDLQYEQQAYRHRIEFFKYIFKITKKHNRQILSWLDYGCAYGHFIEYLKEEEIMSYGIEISDDSRILGKQKGLNVFKEFNELPQNLLFDAISFIDTLYYSLDPKSLLSKACSYLNDNGILILRDTNRNWLVKFDKYFRRKEICTALIDHVIGYSRKSIFLLLRNNGFEILESKYIERGKYRSKRDRYFYLLASNIYYVSFGLINFMPGHIIIARKKTKY